MGRRDQNPEPRTDTRATAPAPPLSITRGPGVPADTESILHALPAWFGDQDALRQYVETSAQYDTFTAHLNGRAVGLLSLEPVDASTAEIHLMAVHADHRATGVGTQLLHAAQQHLASAGLNALQVKTLSTRSPDPHYAQTRRFYNARGFQPVQELPGVWGPHTPCLLMSKALALG